MSNSNNTNSTNGLCRYKDMFGKPNVGLRVYRIFDIAIMDTVVVIAFVLIFTTFTNYRFWPTLAFVFVLGIIAHRMFCVRTGLDKKLFPDNT